MYICAYGDQNIVYFWFANVIAIIFNRIKTYVNKIIICIVKKKIMWLLQKYQSTGGFWFNVPSCRNVWDTW